ncbi:ISKra4 family transposase [Paraburkholderia mimosarum]|uniref:ISKra4 family transposase n=1 Tax=Paraburkholderia mimosarum TaxID=312026 RepID=UPI00040EC3DD|nr:ISKra4 family transposase [Paraburkholderia mimosarum]
MKLGWNILLQRQGTSDTIAVCTVQRPLIDATPADFGLSLVEGRQILAALQQLVAQDQINAYDRLRRNCRECGSYRRIKDWRSRTFATAIGKVQVKVPRVMSCLCTPEPYDENGDSVGLRFSECSIEPLLPTRRTPELTYLCAKHGASVSYREAARSVADLAGLKKLSHSTVRKDTVQCGEYVENEQFRIGWLAGARKRNRAGHLRIAIDGTVLSANQFQEVRKFEVIAGRVERDGLVSRRFVSALQRPSLTRVLVAGALDQCGWVPSTMIDVISDGARGMRSLVTSVAPRVSPRILDWFHVSMKLHAIRTSICAYNYFSEKPEIIQRSERLLTKVRDALWRGRGETAIEMLRTMSATLAIASEQLPFFYRLTSGTAYRATGRLLTFLEHNKTDLVDYQRARTEGRRVSSASAESVMNHLINRRLSKRQQMRWSMKGAHYLLQTRVELLDGRLQSCFMKRFPHFRSPEVV